MEVTHLTEDEMADIKKEVSVMCMKVCKTRCVNMSVNMLADYDSIKWKRKRCWFADHKPDRNI